jgi:hypothetical protein
MLAPPTAETVLVISRSFVFASSIACALIIVSFTLFARDQLAGASKVQVSQLATTAAPPDRTPSPHHRTGQPRRFIDGAARALTSPFDHAIPSDSDWVRHGAPAAFGLLVYGLGLGYLARFTRGLA